MSCVKIINGKIVRDESTGTSSPLITTKRRRSSISELNQEEVEKINQLASLQAISEDDHDTTTEKQGVSWADLSSLKVAVFGLQVATKHIFAASIVSLIAAGVNGLLAMLLFVYLGTIYSSKMAKKDETDVSTNKAVTRSVSLPTLPRASSPSGLSPRSAQISPRRPINTLSSLRLSTECLDMPSTVTGA